MPVVPCPRSECRRNLQVADSAVGKAVRCPNCGQVFRLVAPAAPPPAVPVQAPTATVVLAAAAETPPLAIPAVGEALPAVPPPTFAEPALPGTMAASLPLACPVAAPVPLTGPSPATPVASPPAEPEYPLPARIGRFEIRQRLGEGAFGLVYRAYDPQLDRDVALKVAKPQALNTEARVKRFLREAKAAANLRHPNIVPVHDSGTDGAHSSIASAFIPGKSLAAALEEQGDGKGLEARRAVIGMVVVALALMVRAMNAANELAQSERKALAGETAARGKADEQAQALLAEQNRTRQSLYIAQINLAQNDWREAEVPRMVERLETLRPAPGQGDFRNFEWHYLWRLCHSNAALPLRGHEGAVTSVAFSGDGTRIASGSGDPFDGKAGELKVWDALTGKEVFPLQGHEGAVASVAYSRDGRLIAGGGTKGTIRLWDAATGKELPPLQGHAEGVNCLAFSADSKRLVSCSSDRTIKVWNVAGGKAELTLKGHASFVNCAVISPDGQRIVSGGFDRAVKVWDAVTGQEVLSLVSDSGYIAGVAISPDGQRIVSTGVGKTVMWDGRAVDTPPAR